jgi:hypothetical protein
VEVCVVKKKFRVSERETVEVETKMVATPMGVVPITTKRTTLHLPALVERPAKPREKPSVARCQPKQRSNHPYILSGEERATMEIALAAIMRFKLAFDDWVEVGRAVIAARQIAVRVGGRKTFHTILEQERIMPPLAKSTASRLEKIMADLDGVKMWRATLTESQRFEWASPVSICNRCPVLRPRLSSAPKKPTRLQNAETENASLKVEVEQLRQQRRVFDDKSGSVDDIVAAIDRSVTDAKRDAVFRKLSLLWGRAPQPKRAARREAPKAIRQPGSMSTKH